MNGSTIAEISSVTENLAIYHDGSNPARTFNSSRVLDTYGTITSRELLDSLNHFFTSSIK
jgi:hypothetical protein